VVFFVFGTIVGSLLNVCIHRMPRGESIVFPPSHCPHCQYAIPWYLNVPLFTWLYLRGRCANCGAKISVRYFLVELLTGVAFLGAWLAYGTAIPCPGACVLPAAGRVYRRHVHRFRALHHSQTKSPSADSRVAGFLSLSSGALPARSRHGNGGMRASLLGSSPEPGSFTSFCGWANCCLAARSSPCPRTPGDLHRNGAAPARPGNSL
jgi:hypothetical protein